MPYGQDDAAQKPQSLKADLTLLPAALEAALHGQQLQPVLREMCIRDRSREVSTEV